jgi:hypothetical protein
MTGFPTALLTLVILTGRRSERFEERIKTRIIKQIAPGVGGTPGASLSEALGGDPHPAGETGPELRGLVVLSASGLPDGDASGYAKMRFAHASNA